MKLFFTLFLVIIGFSGVAQITTTNTLTPQQLVEQILVGQGVQVSNIEYNGSQVAAQVTQGNALFFNATGSAPTFPFNTGVFLKTEGGTGDISTDPDLNALATNSVENGVIIEFDFIPLGDTLSFEYAFASSEYPTYVCSNFNDVFGFFISGPGIAGTFSNAGENLAIIPNSANIPVSINTVNSGVAGGAGNAATCFAQDPNWTNNSVFFTTTYMGMVGYPYNGGTVGLTAIRNLQCGQPYHIRLALSNVGDQALNSGVFLKSNSFSSDAVSVSVATVTGDTSVVEGCSTASFFFTRPADDTASILIINYTITGDATMGTDFNNLANPIVFLPGQDSVTLTFNPLQDNLSESPEHVIITVYTISACGDSIESVGDLWILDGPDLLINESNPTVFCRTDSILVNAFASGGYPPYTYSWNVNGQTGDTAYVPGLTNGTFNYTVIATDQCGFTGTDTVTVTVNQTLFVDTVYMQPTNACQNTGVTIGTGAGLTGQPQYHWEGPGNSTQYEIDASVMQNLPVGWYYFSIQDNVCFVEDSILITPLPAPIAEISASILSGCSPLSVTFSNTSQNANSYSWNFGDGSTVYSVTNLDAQSHDFTQNSTITLIATDGVCSDTTTTSISISICGCTNPIALNYNPAAQVDNGSCVLPIPVILAPNVFTPNGDGDNDQFSIDATNTSNIAFTILNRWGNKIVEVSGTNPVWNGFSNGNEMVDGVYFYIYEVTGIAGDKFAGQGFVHLIRD